MTGCTTDDSTEEPDFVVKDADEKKDVDFTGFEFEGDNDDEDEDNENAVSLEKLKKDIMGPLEPELDFDNGLCLCSKAGLM